VSGFAVVGDARALALGGHAGANTGTGGASVVFALGDAAAPDAGATVVRWREAPAGDGAPGERLIAPGGEGLWRRAPWPAADALFAHAGSPGSGALVVGPEEPRARLLAELEERGTPGLGAELLDAEALLAADVVVLLGALGPREPLVASAPAVLAAGRVLVAPRADPAFGLHAGIDHLAFSDQHQAAQYVDAALRHPEAFESIRAFATQAAEAHRASRVYARLAADLELGIA
jgi:hypothetical protein